MKGWFAIALFLALASFAAMANDSRFRLRKHLWKHRVLLVFAPSPNHPSSLRQRQYYEQNVEGFRERELLFVPVIPGETTTVRNQRMDAETQSELRRDYGVQQDAFAVVLIGKDGGTKLRRGNPVASDELFALIDSMPMRQQEMRQASPAPR